MSHAATDRQSLPEQRTALAVAPCSAWLRGADAAHKEDRFFEEPRNPYKAGTKRAEAWKKGYAAYHES